ncbi:unnamed protein product [Anisakis simplex]|uniref:Probable GMP synthase [glutamine-hydrolyzing] (inferred by orthology to a C. elegans protein) n=1 Tax=Anisakis simplex TaxID=6269 RepID=A0A0M3JH37_ANISI|nr:unnamed protein product [Anisakis simplex]
MEVDNDSNADLNVNRNKSSLINGNKIATSRRLRTNSKLEDACKQRVAILDFGAQFGKVIDRRIREKNVMSEMLPLDTKASDLISKGYYKYVCWFCFDLIL